MTAERQQLLVERLLRRFVSVLMWTSTLLLAAFGIYFTIANYPWVALGGALMIVLVTAYRERKRRARRKSSETARRRDRATRTIDRAGVEE